MEAEYLPEFNSESGSEDSEEEVWSSNSHTSSADNTSWITWWLSAPGREYFAEVPEEFIEDEFNMTGLSHVVPYYRQALELILDLEPDDGVYPVIAEAAAIEAAAELLYGLVHQRYITSRNGLIAMEEKYNDADFGECPRTLCQKTPVLPIGLSDVPEFDCVKLYCPSCLDVYTPARSRFVNIDGAFFGTTFPHLFFMTFTDIRPGVFKSQVGHYVPKIYGFKVSSLAPSGPRMSWLRQGLNGHMPDDDNNESKDTVDVEQDVSMKNSFSLPAAEGASGKASLQSYKIEDQLVDPSQSAQTAPRADLETKFNGSPKIGSMLRQGNDHSTIRGS